MNDSKNKKITAALIGTMILSIAAWILAFLAIWAFRTWRGLRMDEMMFQLRAPLEGTGDGIIIRGVLESVLPALLLTVLTGVLYYIERKRNREKTVLLCSAVPSVAAVIVTLSTARDLIWEII